VPAGLPPEAGMFTAPTAIRAIKKEASIDYIETNAKVLVGERVLTSGLDQIYPKGLLVGYVTSVGTRQIFQQIDLTISVDVQKLEEVLVLKKEPQS
jgi:rod shape-determining protein MreC